MEDYDFETLATERPHAGVARPYQPIGLPPPAKPKQRSLPPHHNDAGYWILAAMYRPMDVATIARLTGLPRIGIEARLAGLKVERRVYELDGLWGKV